MTRTKTRKIAITGTLATVLTVFIVLAVFAGCRPKPQAEFQLGHSIGTDQLLGYVAAEEGFFKEEGLNVTLTGFESNSELAAGLESGRLDVVFLGSVPTITYQAAKHDLTIFGGAMTSGHAYVLKTRYIPADFKEGDISVLKGRNIASFKNSILDYELQVLLRKNNIEIGEGPDKVNIVYFGGQTAAYSAFTGNEIDGVSVTPPWTARANAEGHTVVYYCNKVSIFENQPCCRQVALTSSLAARPDTYIAFERAIIKAYKFSQENHEKTVEHVAKYVPIDKKIIDYEIYSGYALSHPDPDKKATTLLKKGVVEFGFTNGADYDLEKLYNLDIYRKALAQLLAKNPNDSVYKSLETHFNSAN